MNRPHICLSVAAMDGAFEKMYRALQPLADVQICGLGDYSLAGADIFIGKQMDAKKLEGADRLKAVFAYKTGVDDFPVGEFAKRGIMLVNSHVNSRYIAEYAFGLAVALVSRIAEFDRRMRRGDWSSGDPYWKSLFGMKAGLVGYGHIGREIAKLLTANGIPCFTIDRGKNYGSVKAVESLQRLCAEADILFLSLPKTEQTDNMFNGSIFGLLTGKYLVNVGRSNCIDEAALFKALKSGGMGGAAIDTWKVKSRKEGEVLFPFAYPFNELENVVLSSHKAMQLSDGHERYVADITRCVADYINGSVPENIVDCSKGY